MTCKKKKTTKEQTALEVIKAIATMLSEGAGGSLTWKCSNYGSGMAKLYVVEEEYMPKETRR